MRRTNCPDNPGQSVRRTAGTHPLKGVCVPASVRHCPLSAVSFKRKGT